METEKKMLVKKGWKTPELIVLVRNKPEDTVLSSCKQAGNSPHSAHYLGCFWLSDMGGCAFCSDGGGS